MGSEFRYGLEKVLSTQNYPTHRLASTHCVLRFNPIKCTFNIASSHTHTHTHKHTSKHTIWYFIPRPNIHLSCSSTNPSIHLSWQITSSLTYIYHTWYIIKAANKSWQKGRHGNKVLIIIYIPNF